MWQDVTIKMRLFIPEDWSPQAAETHVRSLIRTARLMEQEKRSIEVEVPVVRVADEDAPCLCTRHGDMEDRRGCPAHDV